MPVRDKIARMKYIPEDEMKEQLDNIQTELKESIDKLISKGGILNA